MKRVQSILFAIVVLIGFGAIAQTPPATPVPDIASLESDVVSSAAKLRAAADQAEAKASELQARVEKAEAGWQVTNAALATAIAERDALAQSMTGYKSRMDAQRQIAETVARVNQEREASAARHRKAQATPITVKVGEVIQTALNKAKPGDFVRVAPGVYNQGVAVPSGVGLVLYDATLDGKGRTYAITAGHGATIIGGTIANWKGVNDRDKSAVRAVGDNVTIDGVIIEKIDGSGFGANVVQAPRLIGCTIRDTTGSAYLLGGGEQAECFNPVILDCTIERYNTAKNSVGSGVGVNKKTRTVNALVAHNLFRDGFGTATWGDILNRDYTYYANGFDNIKHSIEKWDGNGIYCEMGIGTKSLIAANSFKRMTGAAITIAESGGILVTGNTLDGKYIELRDVRDQLPNAHKQRGSYTKYDGPRVFIRAGLRDIAIFDNTLLNGAKDDWISGAPGKVGANWDGNPAAYLAKNNVVWIK